MNRKFKADAHFLLGLKQKMKPRGDRGRKKVSGTSSFWGLALQRA